MLKLDSPGVGGCGGGGGSSSSNGSGKSNSGVGLYSSSGAYSDHSRMPLRARISEVLAFLAVFALIASSAMQIAMVWVSFWVRVEEIRTRSVSFHRRTVAFPLWGLWVAALLGYRRMIYKRIAPDMANLFMHAEILALVVLGMTGEFSSLCVTVGVWGNEWYDCLSSVSTQSSSQLKDTPTSRGLMQRRPAAGCCCTRPKNSRSRADLSSIYYMIRI